MFEEITFNVNNECLICYDCKERRFTLSFAERSDWSKQHIEFLIKIIEELEKHVESLDALCRADEEVKE